MGRDLERGRPEPHTLGSRIETNTLPSSSTGGGQVAIAWLPDHLEHTRGAASLGIVFDLKETATLPVQLPPWQKG